MSGHVAEVSFCPDMFEIGWLFPCAIIKSIAWCYCIPFVTGFIALSNNFPADVHRIRTSFTFQVSPCGTDTDVAITLDGQISLWNSTRPSLEDFFSMPCLALGSLPFNESCRKFGPTLITWSLLSHSHNLWATANFNLKFSRGYKWLNSLRMHMVLNTRKIIPLTRFR